jgi:hypothetical protein
MMHPLIHFKGMPSIGFMVVHVISILYMGQV